ncbi:MAG TPA: hypothetical protein VGO69_02010, partial [Pyrinomonadaceae bacterium]|nr:hypothetical protein [Pyrinomonadaceae bacterium]
QSTARANGATISVGEFERLCDEIYRDRFEIYDFNPNVTKREAVLWMLLGCLISLLSVTDAELQSFVDSSSRDPYGESLCKLLGERAAPPFDPQPFVEELSKKVESE